MQIPWNLIIGIGISLALFLIFRAAVLWYWKVDEVVGLLKEISNKLKKEQREEERQP